MEKTVIKDTIFDNSWDLVCKIYLSRFPTSPYFPMLLNHELSSISWDVNNQIFHCEKRSTMYLPVPAVLRRLANVDHCYVFQSMTIDLKKQIMTEFSMTRQNSKTYCLKEDAEWKSSDQNKTVFHEVSSFTLTSKFPKIMRKLVMKKIVENYEEGYSTAREVDSLIKD